MATIKDVAHHAEVSVATVSRVINRNGYVNEDTRKKVEAAVDLLNYKPNSVARSLFKKQSKTIGIIVPDITNPYFPELVRGVEDYLIQKGFTTILCNSDEDPEKERLYLDVMKQKYVDGAIIVSNTIERDLIAEYDMPVVALDRSIHQDIPTFAIDNRDGGRKAAEHLLEVGCTRIGHIKGPDKVENSDNRYLGYIDVIKQQDWFLSSYVVEGNFDQKQAAKVTKELLQSHPEIDGIFAGNDVMALGALKAAESLNLNVPEDLAIIGFDGIDLTEMTKPELSTLSQPIYQMSREAAEALTALIEGKMVKEKENVFPSTLIKRQSTKR
ncbi:LacI family DNA-binding transcriptional regulator [Alkalibacillus haloalkaliphilus]|uniref:LacI family DNA-binding transcriptional regulator n=1 Tax=Alkalibacillus haloalkaliphilus TaxID=94136 RepID=UPI002936C916|nr:LacI family DNA-binding transcriptional regulator [Alkalibacillus haloalkaliphilus]MDV2582208.1 LacI family DNA-binding transcriptional regulator [Alkalibacillus haloalkaliphilus]